MDQLLDGSRGAEGPLDAAGDGGLMTSPLHLAYFYGASPPAAAPGACDAGCSASGPSAPGSPGSDSSDLSSASAVSSCGAVESRPRGSARAERLQGTRSPPHRAGGAAPAPLRPGHPRPLRLPWPAAPATLALAVQATAGCRARCPASGRSKPSHGREAQAPRRRLGSETLTSGGRGAR